MSVGEEEHGIEEDVEVAEVGGGPSKHGTEVRAFEESPPHDATAKEFLNCHWFIDEKWRAIISPPPGRRTGKTKAYVIKIKQQIQKRTLGKGENKEEVFLVGGFFLDPEAYKNWDTKNLWEENSNVAHSFKRVKRNADARKRK